MKTFIHDDFLLHTETARRLYHAYARPMPIIDYHNHLPPQEIAQDRMFENLAQLWLDGDHYKWRAMRANGVPEHYITGPATDEERFAKWAETVPYTARNPLYHWTHLELKNPFGITRLLGPDTAREIYQAASAQLRDGLGARQLLKHFNVAALCTTDDPLDSLAHHAALVREADFATKVLPTFRPDKAMMPEDAGQYTHYLDLLAERTGRQTNTWTAFLEAMQQRHDYFAAHGCRLSDHGLETFHADDYTESEIRRIFGKIRAGQVLSPDEVSAYKSACLYEFARMDAEKGWTQQFHIGALRNNNTRMRQRLGPDAGFDSIGDFPVARPMARFLDRLDRDGLLPKTILYNLNPAHSEVFATMLGNFNGGSVAGKMQYGAAWWFLDQKDGMEKQLDVLSNMGLLSRFVGMLTDSRSFLSFSRHEYFRRILCNMLGDDVRDGELPDDEKWLGKLVQDICYFNAEQYFGL